eukprot:sb/3465730/
MVMRWLPASMHHYLIRFTVYVVPIIPLIWDTIDVALDGIYFFKLEQGEMIDSSITRNPLVNNALIGFSALGALKTPLLVLVIGNFWDVMITPRREGNFTLSMVALSPTAISNLYVSIIIYMTEDCVELFLEYFWIEKYMSTHPNRTIIVRNVISALVSMVPLISQMIKLKDNLYIAEQIDHERQRVEKKRGKKSMTEEDGSLLQEIDLKAHVEKSKKQKIFMAWVSLSIVSALSSFGTVLRAIGAVYQMMSHKIPDSCLFVSDEGYLLQKPLDDECMRFIDYTIMFFNFLPAAIYTIFTVLYVFYKTLLLCCSILDRGDTINSVPPSVNNPGSRVKVLIQDQGKSQYTVVVDFGGEGDPEVRVQREQPTESGNTGP